ncbi:MAG: DUF664 domain-containing protein [Chloroflexi bacterium]|nr:DUF664 domain-containing protein [Chloroflexota bacterium]
MDAEARDLLGEIGRLREKTRSLVAKATDQAVNWKPDVPETNSPAILVTHMCGSESPWIHRLVGGRQISRNRDSEFAKPVSTVSGLLKLLDQTGAATEQVLGGETSASLGRALETGRPEIAKTARDCILHSLAHQAEHVGHLELTLQLWEARRK